MNRTTKRKKNRRQEQKQSWKSKEKRLKSAKNKRTKESSEFLHGIRFIDMVIAGLGYSADDYIAAKSSTEKTSDDAVAPYLSRKEAATLLRCSTDTVDNLANAGKIRKVKLSSARCGHVLIERESLIKFLHNSVSRTINNKRCGSNRISQPKGF